MSRKPGVPFLLKFGRPLRASMATPSRYDELRQVAVVLENGMWVPALNADRRVESQTIVTEVKKETTDE